MAHDLSGRLELALLRLHHALKTASSAHAACWAITSEAMAYLGLEDCVVYLLSADGSHLVQHAAFGPKQSAPGVLESFISLRLGEGIVGSAALLRTTQRVDDVRLDPRYVLDDAPRLSEIAVPIVLAEQLIGVIDSEHSQLGFFDERHIQVLEAIAESAAPRLLWFREQLGAQH